MTVTIRRTTPADLEYVTANWRDCDRREILAQWWNNESASYARFANQVLGAPGTVAIVRTALLDGKPVAIWGASEQQPMVWTVFAFGTDGWPRVVRTISKHIKRVLIPVLRDRGANAAECWAHVEHEQACRWLEWLGAKPLCEMPRGKNGEIFRLYVWEK